MTFLVRYQDESFQGSVGLAKDFNEAKTLASVHLKEAEEYYWDAFDDDKIPPLTLKWTPLGSGLLATVAMHGPNGEVEEDSNYVYFVESI